MKRRRRLPKKMSKIRGNRVRGLLPKQERRPGDGQRLTWDTVRPLHQLWLGYMAELMGIAIEGARSPASVASGETVASSAPIIGEREAATDHGFTSSQLASWQQKLTKADFHGCRLRGARKIVRG